jgi:UDP-GlcNAc:undecaprenyl-phosphate/decaprenyl-phosphate GlcNAc-1-phosphate transferase
MNISQLIAYPLAFSALIVAFLTPFVLRLVTKWKLIDDPRKNTHPKVIHTTPTPRGGGLAIYLSFVVSTLILLPLDQHLLGIIAGATLLVILGLLDDKYDLSPYVRIPVQIIAALCPVAAGIGISFLLNGSLDLSQPQLTFSLLGEDHSIWILADLFALVWIVAIMNFTNMGAKGVPGQLPGVVSIAAFTIAILSLKFSADITEWPVTMLAAITAGSFLGFLPYNTFPQSIMPSFSGSNLGGYLLAVLAILSTAKVGTLLVVMAVPIIDTSYTMIRRVLSGKSPVWGDRGHLHHRLLDLGLSQLQVTIFYWGITALLGILALYLNAASKFYTIIGISIFLGSALLVLTYRPKNKS